MTHTPLKEGDAVVVAGHTPFAQKGAKGTVESVLGDFASVNFDGEITYFCPVRCLELAEPQQLSPTLPDGWFSWSGGACPVPEDAVVEIKTKRPYYSAQVLALMANWAHEDSDYDIVAYRIVPQQLSLPGVEPPAVANAAAILEAAAGHMRDRAKTYDRPAGERSMGRAVAALNVILGREALSESEGWLLLQLLKDVRDRTGERPHRDSLEDCVAYAALKAESRLTERSEK